ncbi:HipA domain-containing protein, partial [Marinilabiliaceae bacterium AAT]|nr:HipA domain-containing protein [Plebeiobacterium sediminum]
GLTQLAPAYDLLSTRLVIPEKDDPEELALTMDGRKRKFRIGDFQQLAKSLKLKQKQVDNISKRFQKVMPTVLDFINNSFLPEHKKLEYKELIQERASRLFT